MQFKQEILEQKKLGWTEMCLWISQRYGKKCMLFLFNIYRQRILLNFVISHTVPSLQLGIEQKTSIG